MVMMEELPNNANDLAFESRVRRFIHYTRLRFLLSNNTSQSMPSMQQSKKEDGRSQNTREHHIHPNNSSNFLLWKNTVSDVCQDISWLLTMPCCERFCRAIPRQRPIPYQSCPFWMLMSRMKDSLPLISNCPRHALGDLQMWMSICVWHLFNLCCSEDNTTLGTKRVEKSMENHNRG